MTAGFATVGDVECCEEIDIGLLDTRLGVLNSEYPESDTPDISDERLLSLLLAIPNLP